MEPDGLIKFATLCRDAKYDREWKGVEWTVQDGVLIIRGSNERRDWFRNFNIATADGVHVGFWKAAHKIVESERREWVCVTGHSQGGGIATILSHLTGRVAITFGAPMTAQTGHEFGGEVIRVVNRNDIVCRLPIVGDWKHVGKLVYIGFDGKLHHSVQKLDGLIGRFKAWRKGEWFSSVYDHSISRYVENLENIK